MAPTTLGRVALIGAGHVGIHYARHLTAAGATLSVYDRSADAIAQAQACGALATGSCAEAATGADFVLLAVPDPMAVRSALTGEDGVLTGAPEGALIIDASTGDPETAREMHAAAKVAGLDYIEAPISGGEPGGAGTDGATAANVTFMVGGDRAAYERALPVLEILGSHALYLGPPGSGSIVKLISNHIAGLINLITAEAFTLGAAAGFGYETLLEVFAHTDASSYMLHDYIGPRLRRGDFEAGFSVDLMYKDHRLAGELAQQLKVPMLFNQLAMETYQLLRAKGSGHKDVTEMHRFLAELTATTIDARAPVRTPRD